MRVIGKMQQLFSYHGDIDAARAVATIATLTELSVIDISEINKSSEKGGLYISKDGIIFDKFDSHSEKQATFKMVPTGLRTKFNGHPLVASFVKSKGTWCGVNIDIPEKIFASYRKAYGRAGFSTAYSELFCGEHHGRDITGFGLEGLTGKVEEDEQKTELSTEADIDYLKIALDKAEKCLLDTAMNKSKRKKAEAKVDNIKKQITSLEEKLKAEKGQAETEQAEPEQAEQTEQADGVISTEPINTEPEQTETASVLNSEEQNDETTSVEPVQTASTQVETPTEPLGQADTTQEKETTSEPIKETIEPIENTAEDVTEPTPTDETTSNNDTVLNSAEQSGRLSETEPVEEDTKEAIARLKKGRKSKSTGTQRKKKVQKTKDTETSTTTDKQGTESTTNVDKPDTPSDLIKSNEAEMRAEIGDNVSEEEVTLMSELLTEIYNLLLDKEDWKKDNGRSLLEYIKGLVVCIETYRRMRRKTDNGFVMSDNGKKLLFNSGLIDKYGNFIYLLDHTAVDSFERFSSKVITVVKSKTSLLDEGFSIDKIRVMPKRFKFVENNRELVFNATIDDFDLIDTEHLNHIINERRSRFPAKYANESCKNIADKIRVNIENALAIQEVNYKYIVPMYNIGNHELEFLIPLHLDTTYGQKPELCIIIAKKNNLWKIFTIIGADLAYSNARLISKVDRVWSE